MPSLATIDRIAPEGTTAGWSPDLDRRLKDVVRQLKRLGGTASAQSLDGLRRNLDDPAVRVAVFGEFNRGKSTLINALLGRPVLPSSLVPTTGHVTYVVGRDGGHGDDVLLHRPEGGIEQVDWDALSDSVALDDQGLVPEAVERVDVRVDIDWLRRGVTFIDTPGVNDDDRLTQRAKQAIVLADVVLLVLDGTQLLTSLEQDLDVEASSALSVKPRVPVVNFMGRVPTSQRAELRQRLARWCEAHLEPVFDKTWYEVDALKALRHEVEGRTAPKDDFNALRRQLRALADEHGKALRQESRRRQLCHNLRHLDETNHLELESLRQDADRVAVKRRDLRRQVGQDLHRLQSRTESLRSGLLLRAQVILDQHVRTFLDDTIDAKPIHQLKTQVSSWTQTAFEQAVEELESQADEALQDCVRGIDDLTPEPLTLSERLTLQGLVAMTRQDPIEADPGEVVTSAVVGSILGSVLLPGLGTVGGAALGGWLASALGRKEPDPRPPLRRAVRRAWKTSTADAKRQLEAQLEKRTDDLQARLQTRYEELVAAEHDTGNDEIHHRQALHDTLQTLLQDLGDTP